MKPKLFKISEAASVCGVAPSLVRHYESLGLITPAVTDMETNYRYYDVVEIERLLMILRLKESGMSLKEISGYLEGILSAEDYIATLTRCRERIERSIEELKLRDYRTSHMAVQHTFIRRRFCVARDFLASDIEDAVACYYAHVSDCIKRGIRFSRELLNFCEFPDSGFLNGALSLENFPVRVCVCADESHIPADAVVYPPTRALSVIFFGYYDQIPSAYSVLADYVKMHNFTLSGNPQEIYLEGDNTDEQKKYVTRIVLPVK